MLKSVHQQCASQLPVGSKLHRKRVSTAQLESGPGITSAQRREEREVGRKEKQLSKESNHVNIRR